MSAPLKETSSQTAGPYVHIGLAPAQAGFEIFSRNFGNALVSAATRGERVRIEGRVLDGDGEPVRDALIELWQANAAGRYAHPADARQAPLDPAFRGWGRACTDFDSGVFVFDTIKPGAVTSRGGGRCAPHLSLWVVARGINVGLHTRMYFSDEAQANAADPVLNLIPSAARRRTLIGTRDAVDAVYRFDIVLQGANETVFFDI